MLQMASATSDAKTVRYFHIQFHVLFLSPDLSLYYIPSTFETVFSMDVQLLNCFPCDFIKVEDYTTNSALMKQKHCVTLHKHSST